MFKKTFLSAMLALTGIALYAQDIDQMISSMSRKEKIAQIVIVEIESADDSVRRAAKAQLARQGLGGLIVMDDNLTANMRLINDLQKEAKIPMMVTIDGEWGASMRYREYAYFPRAMQLGALRDPLHIYRMGRLIGEELSQLKIFVNFAPVVDINNNPANPVINTRSFGEDREKVAEFGCAYMKGMKDAGVAGSAKHFPGHGDTDVDSHKGLPVLTFNRSRLDSLELYPFRRMISEGVDMIMIGHLSVPALDPTGTPASISSTIVTDILRKELGFNGIIITDALQMKGVATDYADASLAAYKAGADILLMPLDASATIRDLDAAFERGELSETDLDERVRKMLSLKKRCGMLANGYSPLIEISELATMAKRPLTEAYIQELSDRSMTLVRNKSRLPLTADVKTAYVAYNSVSDESKEFFRLMTNYCDAQRFDIPAGATPAQIDSVHRLVKKYKNVVVAFHSGAPMPSSGGPKRFAQIDSASFARIASWGKRQNLFGVYLGNPYDLNRMPSHKLFDTFIIGYSDNKFNNKAAVRALYLGGAQGVLPVAAGGYPCGFKADRVK
ncbi:MAG: glycosyl hydrolase family 3 [Bacteroidales bacterium]|nr:glycosyl hydrolase family 3 [Candidatus Cacconaster merdequi]